MGDYVCEKHGLSTQTQRKETHVWISFLLNVINYVKYGNRMNMENFVTCFDMGFDRMVVSCVLGFNSQF